MKKYKRLKPKFRKMLKSTQCAGILIWKIEQKGSKIYLLKYLIGKINNT